MTNDEYYLNVIRHLSLLIRHSNNVFHCPGILNVKIAGAGAAQTAEIGTAADGLTQIMCQRPDIGAFAAYDFKIRPQCTGIIRMLPDLMSFFT